MGTISPIAGIISVVCMVAAIVANPAVEREIKKRGILYSMMLLHTSIAFAMCAYTIGIVVTILNLAGITK